MPVVSARVHSLLFRVLEQFVQCIVGVNGASRADAMYNDRCRSNVSMNLVVMHRQSCIQFSLPSYVPVALRRVLYIE